MKIILLFIIFKAFQLYTHLYLSKRTYVLMHERTIK